MSQWKEQSCQHLLTAVFLSTHHENHRSRNLLNPFTRNDKAPQVCNHIGCPACKQFLQFLFSDIVFAAFFIASRPPDAPFPVSAYLKMFSFVKPASLGTIFPIDVHTSAIFPRNDTSRARKLTMVTMMPGTLCRSSKTIKPRSVVADGAFADRGIEDV